MDIESQLISITQNFLLEQKKRTAQAVSSEALLDKDLGIDSLSKAELFRRIEQHFAIRFSNEVMAQTKNLKEIVAAIIAAKPAVEMKSITIEPQKRSQVNLSSLKTLNEVLIQYARQQPDRVHLYLRDENGKEELITYGELFDRAARIANSLIKMGIKPNETVAIMLLTDRDFFECFFGILLAGAVPVPIYPPFRLDQIEEYALRATKILKNAEARILITFSRVKMLSKILQAHVPGLFAVKRPVQLKNNKKSLPRLMRTGDDPALIQYTSGSTGDPKGVLLLHKNIIANIQALLKTIEIKPADAVVSWLPLYHDMGLLGWIICLYAGLPIIILSPLTFLNRPEQWLWAIHYHRATISAAPNFAYELCAKKINDKDIEGLDLSSWRIAFNGSEGIQRKTLENFDQKFHHYGFKKKAFVPAYGLAENTVALTVPDIQKEFRTDTIDREIFEKESRAVTVDYQKNTIEFISCGKPIIDHEMRIVDDHQKVLPERRVGNIQFRGPSAMHGYYRRPMLTQSIYHDGWWETGDLGYIADEELFITGRRKDLIIKGGRNIYPESYEEICGNLKGVIKGNVITFGIKDIETGTEKIIIVAESWLSEKEKIENLEMQIIQETSQQLGTSPDEVIIVAANTVPKTSSGKLQRSKCQELYLKRHLTKTPKKFQQQILSLFAKAISKRIFYFIKKLGQAFYTGYAWIILTITFIPSWLLSLIIPRKTAAKLLKWWSCVYFYLIFCPIHVRNRENLYSDQPIIYVANHSSFSDILILLALLPAGTLFVAKKELLKTPILSGMIKKLKMITIDRQELAKDAADIQLVRKSLEKHSILIFPEGTFTYASGLRPFKLGAFQLAVDHNTPICPIAIRGSRNFLRSGSVLLCPGLLQVIVNQIIKPQTNGWKKVNELRLQAQKIIAEQSGEPEIDLIHD